MTISTYKSKLIQAQTEKSDTNIEELDYLLYLESSASNFQTVGIGDDSWLNALD